MRVIGMISGTSADAIEVVVCDLNGEPPRLELDVLGARTERIDIEPTIAISNDQPAPILDEADLGIAAVTGPEVLSGSTRLKAGTAQKLILNMLSTTTMVQLGKVHGNRMIDVAVTNQKLRRRAVAIVADLVGCDQGAAADLLDAADEEVKTAVLMGLACVDAATARSRLDAVDGVLRSAIDGA